MIQTRFLLPVLVLGGTAGLALNNALEAGPAAPLVGTQGDIIVGDIYDFISHGSVGDKSAFSFGSTSCNIGQSEISWFGSTPNHPVIATNIYRIDNGRLEQIGLNWVKHGFATLNGSLCGTCQPTSGTTLGVGCSDPYSAFLNGFQSDLGPRSEVNPYNGVFPYPPNLSGPGFGTLPGRVQVFNDDIDPALNPNARYLVEIHYITPEDNYFLGNGRNNVSVREVDFTGNNPPFNVSFVGPTKRETTAVEQWQALDPTVTITPFNARGDGEMFLASRVAPNISGGWDYDYTLYNRDSDRAARAFAIPVNAGLALTDQDFNDVFYHSGEPQVGTDWAEYDGLYPGTNQRVMAWVGGSFQANPDNNAIRWSSAYSFHVNADSPPTIGDAAVFFFKPGGPAFQFVSTQIPQ